MLVDRLCYLISRLLHLFAALGLVENVRKMALAAVLAVVHRCHEDTSTTLHNNVNIRNPKFTM